METPLLSRRKFCITAAGASLSLVAGGVIREAHAAFAGSNEVTIDLTLNANTALTQVGGALYVTMPSNGDKVIVVRNSNTEVSAFTSVCTHQGCQVNLPVSGVATCPCHGSRFSDNGTVLGGPATSSLQRYSAQLQGSFIYIDSGGAGVKENPATLLKNPPEISWRKESETINLSWGSGNPGKKAVSLFDVQGKRISLHQWAGRDGFTLSTGNLPRGEYVVKVEAAGGDPMVRRVRIY